MHRKLVPKTIGLNPNKRHNAIEITQAVKMIFLWNKKMIFRNLNYNYLSKILNPPQKPHSHKHQHQMEWHERHLKYQKVLG